MIKNQQQQQPTDLLSDSLFKSLADVQHLITPMHKLNPEDGSNKELLLEYVRKNIIGTHEEYLIRTVYGEKPLLYTDYTASGKSLRFIEDYITSQILPLYANTHT